MPGPRREALLLDLDEVRALDGAPGAAAVPDAVRVGRAGGTYRLMGAPAHGARAVPLIDAPHHHVGL